MNVILWQETGIGKTVNGYRKHCYETVGNSARRLVAKWKELVQLTTEAINDTQCVPAASDDMMITTDVKKKVSVESKMDERLGTISSKHKHASKQHLSSTNKYNKTGKHDADDVMFSKPCLPTKVSAVSSLPWCNDRDGGNSSQNQCAVQRPAYISAPTEHQKLSAGDSSCSSAATGHKSRREKCNRLNEFSADDKNKGKCHSHSRVSTKNAKSTSCKTGSRIAIMEYVHTNNDSFATGTVLHENGGEVSNCRVETDKNKSLRKSASKTGHEAVHKGSEKKSSNRHSESNASVPSSAKTHSFSSVSKDHSQADVKESFAVADDVDESEHNRMTFEEMLNYDNRDVRKKKGSTFNGGKCSKRPKSASHSRSHVSPSISKKASKPDSERVSKGASCLPQMLHNSISAEGNKLERSQLIRQPVLPHPEVQVGTDILKHFVTIC